MRTPSFGFNSGESSCWPAGQATCYSNLHRDIAGPERFGNMTRVYYKEAVGAFVVFEPARRTTFEAVSKWKNDLDTKVSMYTDDKPVPAILLANKVRKYFFKVRCLQKATVRYIQNRRSCPDGQILRRTWLCRLVQFFFLFISVS